MGFFLAAFGVQWLPWEGYGLSPALPVVLSLVLGAAFVVLLWSSEAAVPQGRRLLNLAGALFILAILCFDGAGEVPDYLQGVLAISGLVLLGIGGYSVWRSRPMA